MSSQQRVGWRYADLETTMNRAFGEPPEARQADRSSGHRPLPGLARDLSELARALQSERDASAALRRISSAALIEIPAAAAAGITIVERGRYRTEAATADVVERIDRVQYRENDGPCVSSLRDEITVRSDDLSTETRWPKYAAAAYGVGFGSLMSFQLFVQADSLGALNVYAHDRDAFVDEDEDAGVLLAAHAAVAISCKRVEANLRTALESRDVIGQAKGIVMERFKLNADQAFPQRARDQLAVARVRFAAADERRRRRTTHAAEAVLGASREPELTDGRGVRAGGARSARVRACRGARIRSHQDARAGRETP